MLVKQAEPVLASLPLKHFLLFTFDSSLGLGGAVAQLGARLHGMQEVAGSIPASSTIPSAACSPAALSHLYAALLARLRHRDYIPLGNGAPLVPPSRGV